MLSGEIVPQVQDQLDKLMTKDRFEELLKLAQSGHSLAALRQAILETAIAVRTGAPATETTPYYA